MATTEAYRRASVREEATALCKPILDTCKALPYVSTVIRSIRSKSLRKFAEEGDASKLPVRNADRVRRLLVALDAAATPEDMNLPGFRFHGLQGKPKRYAVDASGNYRMTFGWDGPDAIDVDIEDYH
jgi:toxin HigB-1